MKKSRLLGAVCAFLFTLIATVSHAAVLPLESRAGVLAYYDPDWISLRLITNRLKFPHDSTKHYYG